MRNMRLLIVMTAMVFVAAGSLRGITSPRPLILGSRTVAASALSSLPVMKSDKSLSKTILPTARNSKVGQLFVAASAEDGKDDDKTNKNPPPPPPPPRSTHCPPDKDNHHDNDNKNKDHHDSCGKGNDSKNP